MNGKLRILMLHNKYLFPGGEDVSTDMEAELLRSHGHHVTLLVDVNSEFNTAKEKISVSFQSFWSKAWSDRVKTLLQDESFDLLHVQNFFPLISPSVYYAAKWAGVPVVQSVRNYRLACPSANLFRDGSTCEKCVGKRFKFPAIVHRCYKNSLLGSGSIASMLAFHHLRKTWSNEVSKYIAVSDYVKSVLVSDGFAKSRISVKPNFTFRLDCGELKNFEDRDFFLYAGRLTEEKGTDLLVRFWGAVNPSIALKIVGFGDFPNCSAGNVQFLGSRSNSDVVKLMAAAKAVILPGKWPEPFGRVAVEAFGQGTPVVTTGSGGLAEIVKHDVNGKIFSADSKVDFAHAIESLHFDRNLWMTLSRNARKSFERSYSAEANIRRLEEIYWSTIREHKSDYAKI